MLVGWERRSEIQKSLGVSARYYQNQGKNRQEKEEEKEIAFAPKGCP
jgi:hypothetical protein